VLATPPIPQSSFTDFTGNVVFGYSRIGAPTVDPDGVTHVLFEKRHVAYPPRVAWAELWMMNINPDLTYNTVMITSTTEDHNLFPGRIIPDGEGGVVATWTVSPSQPPALVNPYFGAHLPAGGGVGVYGLPLTPSVVPKVAGTPIDPALVLGKNGAAFVTYGVDPELGPEVASFNLQSGSLNWSYRGAPGTSVSLLAAMADGGLLAQDSMMGVIKFTPGGSDDLVAPPLGPDLGYAWTGEWYGTGVDAVTRFGLTSDIDHANVWATPTGNASHNNAAVPLCPCLSQTEAPGALLQPGLRPSDTAPLVGQTYVSLVGDRGLGGHNVGRLFDLAASTRASALTASGDTVFTHRVSSVQDFNTGLTTHGPITGSAFFFGHAMQGNNFTVSLLAAGEGQGADTNITEFNVNQISGAQMGPNASLFIYGCHAGLRPQNRPAGKSIAQALADQLNRAVYAWRVGLFFSNNLNVRRSSDASPTGPTIYMLPEGGANVAPCEFIPGQPEPIGKCGGR
jgi:hypothetical protein